MEAGNGRVCIVGVGSIGMCAVHWCLKRGLGVTAYERNSGVGGVWKHQTPPCHSPAYDSLVTNSSSALMNLSDFPFPFECSAKFPHHSEIKRYYEAYLAHHGLEKHIQFGTKVTKVHKLENGKWRVETDKGDAHVFDAVIVCSGRLWNPNWPGWARQVRMGTITTAIDVVHSSEYRNPKRFHGKSVILVGVGNSALDISLELARHGNVRGRIYLACRSGATILPTKYGTGTPSDIIFASRYFVYATYKWQRMLVLLWLIRGLNREWQKKYGLPAPLGGLGSPSSKVANLKETQLYRQELAKGTIRFCQGISTIDWDHHKAILTDGTVLDCDAIICATGYETNLDFLQEDIRKEILVTAEWEKPDNSGTYQCRYARLYRRVVYPKDPTLAFLGMVTSLGNETCIGEMQARWVSAYLSGIELKKSNLTPEHMQQVCDLEHRAIIKNCGSVPEFVQYVKYMDAFAEDLECVPDTSLSLFLRNPRLWYNLYFGPVLPAHYRLNGPDSLEQAPEIINHLHSKL